MKNKIIDILYEISENELIKENSEIDLFEEGIIDSLGFMILLNRLEEEFDIEIQPSQIPADTWRSVDKIAKMVEGYLEG
ncbi:MAG: D-alanine--poly(phosphoribitol) ligase subunit 2 [Clostridia bacterium]|nr:D-alanine--poly(phosphoribitol) ligase subunit 2 [Clostridia bacterium]